jgi:hypothetical protein
MRIMERGVVLFVFVLVVGNVFLPFIEAKADLKDRVEETKYPYGGRDRYAIRLRTTSFG